MKIAVLLYTILLFTTSNGHRILGLFPHQGLSHFHFFQPVMKALAEAGHEVTVVSPFPNKEPIENYKDEPLPNNGGGFLNAVDLVQFKTQPSYQHFMEFFVLRDWAIDACDLALNSSAIKNILNQGRREPFDLIIVEVFNSDCMLGVAHKLNAPVIGLSSCNIMPWHVSALGLPYEPSFLPTTFTGYSDTMTFTQRLSNWLAVVYTNLMYKMLSQNDVNNLLKRRFGDSIPHVRELAKKVSMVFVNQHYSLSGAKHLSPNVIELGGIHIGKQNKLDAELQNLLDKSEHGVIYISWGSMVKSDTLSDEKREGILHALGKFKQQVVWKYENETMPNKPPNVFIRKWMPQREILCHPNVRVFMTHGGLLGSSEAAYCGVPVVTTPFYGDQFLNSAALVHREMGVLLEYPEYSETTVHHAIRRVLDPKFRKSAKKVSHSFKHRPMTPSQSAVFWSEYVIATKGAPLVKPHTVYANWLTYSGLDIWLSIVAIAAAIIKFLLYLFGKIFKSGEKEKKGKKITSERKDQ